MRSFFRILLLAATVAAFSSPADSRENVFLWESEPGFTALHWIRGNVVLPESHTRLAVPAGTHAFVGADNDAYSQIVGEVGCPCEARVRWPRQGSVKYVFVPAGYVWDGAWKSLDPEFLLASIRQHDELRARTEPNVAVAEAWDRPPAYDKARHVVTWMIRKRYSGGPDDTVAIALVLMRSGYELVSADGVNSGPDATWARLEAAVAAFGVPAGSRYTDVRPGDKAYAPGILFAVYDQADAQLVFTHPGDDRQRLLQAVLFGALLAALGLAFAVLVAVRSGIRRRRGPLVAGSATVVTRVTSAPASEV